MSPGRGAIGMLGYDPFHCLPRCMNRHRPRAPHHRLAALAVLLVATSSGAAVTEIAWGSDGTNEHAFRVAAAGPHEVCGKLAAGTRVHWRFESDQPTDFNIHHHVGKDVFFAAKEDGSRGAEGRFEAKETHDYCWMWTRKAGPAAAVRLRLERER